MLINYVWLSKSNYPNWYVGSTISYKMSHEPTQYHTGLGKYNQIPNDMWKITNFPIRFRSNRLRSNRHPWYAPTQIYVIKKVNKVYLWNFAQM